MEALRQEGERRAQAGAADRSARSARLQPHRRPRGASAADGRPRRLAKAEKLGTGHGEREYSPTTQTTFERASSQPAEIVQVRYDSYANLVAAGVIGRPQPPALPQPFPGFVPDPG
jgi:hypothetical protein